MSAYTQFKKLLDTLLSVLYSLNIIPKVLVRLKMTIYLQCQILSPSDPEVVVRPEKKKNPNQMRDVSLHQQCKPNIIKSID